MRKKRVWAGLLGLGATPAMERLLGDPERLGDLGDRLALAEHPLSLPQLADDLLRRVPASLPQSSFLAHHRGRKKLSQELDRTQGVRPVLLATREERNVCSVVCETPTGAQKQASAER
jgi:hypothetical protein